MISGDFALRGPAAGSNFRSPMTLSLHTHPKMRKDKVFCPHRRPLPKSLLPLLLTPNANALRVASVMTFSFDSVFVQVTLSYLYCWARTS
jgi:hypothetical protein